MQNLKQSRVYLALLALSVQGVAHAGAFSLYTEGSAAAIGNFAAGIAAEAMDASIGWYNPAGLVLLDKQQLVVSGVGVLPSTLISGTSTFQTTGLPTYTQNFFDVQAAKNAVVPALHFALPLTDNVVAGLSMVVPYGLSTEYATNSPVRYAATLTSLETVDISPELGARLTDHLSVGAGLDLEWGRVKFNRVLGAPTLLLAGEMSPYAFDSTSVNKGDSFGVGFHAGILGTFNQNHTRLGLNYQSKIKHTFHGTSVLTGPLADEAFEDASATLVSDNLFSNAIEFPDVLTLSAYQDVTDNVAFLGSIVYTGWDVFRVAQLNNVAAFSSVYGLLYANSTAVEDYRNAWRFALGANYRVSDEWLIRLGGGYDQTPTINAERDVRLPDANRWALSIGSHYQPWPSVGFDVGYTYLFASDESTVDKTEAFGTTSTYNVNAHGKPHAQLIGLQVVWTMDKMLVAGK